MRLLRRWGWIALTVLILDQITKAAARTLTGPVVLIPGVLGLRLCENTGVAFSLLSGSRVLPAVLTLAVLALGALVLRRYILGPLPSAACMLVLGGALGNLIDRVISGSVTDMIEFLFVRFAVFNGADVCLVAGCVLLAVSLLFCPEQWKESVHGNGDKDRDRG